MSEFVKGLNKNDGNDVQYKGNAFLRMLGYVKPYWKTVLVCCILVLALTALELYRPELIGSAIDNYISPLEEEAAAASLSDESVADARFTGILITAALYVGVLALSFICNRGILIFTTTPPTARHSLRVIRMKKALPLRAATNLWICAA